MEIPGDLSGAPGEQDNNKREHVKSVNSANESKASSPPPGFQGSLGPHC